MTYIEFEAAVFEMIIDLYKISVEEIKNREVDMMVDIAVCHSNNVSAVDAAVEVYNYHF